MIPFGYARAATLDEAVELGGQVGARYLAGGPTSST
jgi:CO/xanthine dehydrogenase FAD-binding subunit